MATKKTRDISILVEVVISVPEEWKTEDGMRLRTPDGKEVGVLVGLEYDQQNKDSRILATDLDLREYDCEICTYRNTEIED
jgi:hypothetical protein